MESLASWRKEITNSQTECRVLKILLPHLQEVYARSINESLVHVGRGGDDCQSLIINFIRCHLLVTATYTHYKTAVKIDFPYTPPKKVSHRLIFILNAFHV